MEFSEQSRMKELTNSTKFNNLVYSEIEEIGWDRLVRLSQDLKFLSLRISDKKNKTHILDIQLNMNYPEDPPSISADVPYICDLEWSTNLTLKNVVQQFEEHLEKLQEFWSTLDNIDKTLLVDHYMSSIAMPSRCINLGKDCFVIPCINAIDPRSLPEVRFVGACEFMDTMRKKWQRNSRKWDKERSFVENLEFVLETPLPKSKDVEKKEEQAECGVCYAQRLPFDDELRDKSGSLTDYTCENTNCNRDFHSICLADWLHSITTTRRSFNVLFGNCPYCSEAIAVKINLPNE